MIIIIMGALSEEEHDFINALFCQSNAFLYNISFSILHSHADAEDAVAEAYIKIMEHIEKIHKLPCPQMTSYCVIIVKNAAKDIMRKRKKLAPFENIDLIEDDNSSNDIWKSMDRKRLLEIFPKLGKEDKYLLTLHYVKELKFKEIAQLLDISEETAKKRSQRALKKLRDLYEQEAYYG